MQTLILLCLIADVAIPKVGRPTEEFYGGAGDDVRVTMTADRTELELGESLELTLTITGLANPKEVVRPDLAELELFQEAFRIEKMAAANDTGNDRRVFRYRLFPRSTDVTEVPWFFFRYFDTDRSSSDPNDLFPSATAFEIPLLVTPATQKAPPTPLRVPVFAEQLADVTDEQPWRPGVTGWVLFLVLVPLASLGCALVWHGRYSHRELAARRRTREARRALRALAAIDSNAGEPALSEGERLLRGYNAAHELDPIKFAEWTRLAEECRYGPGTASEVKTLLDQAGELIREAEASE